MAQKKKLIPQLSKTLPKASTGIQGLDEITGGGLPRGRPTLISGALVPEKHYSDWSSWLGAPHSSTNPACSYRSRNRSPT